MTDTDRSTRLEAACTALPLVAILRGLRPEESVEIAQTLYDAGFRLIEIPLNSPEPFDSIARVRAALPADALIGAGTVTTLDAVARLDEIGADPSVLGRQCLEALHEAEDPARRRFPG